METTQLFLEFLNENQNSLSDIVETLSQYEYNEEKYGPIALISTPSHRFLLSSSFQDEITREQPSFPTSS
jgi:hypothetical protein